MNPITIFLRQCITIFSILLPSAGFAQQDAKPFTIQFDSTSVQVMVSAGRIATINKLDNGKTLLYADYLLKGNTIGAVNTRLITEIPDAGIGDTGVVVSQEISPRKEKCFGWWNDRITLRVMQDSVWSVVIISTDNGRNSFQLDFLMNNGAFVLVKAKDISQRFLDMISSYDDKWVSFVTIIGKMKESGKGGHDEYWLNGYEVTISEKQLRRLRGKKVEVSGIVYLHWGNKSPANVKSYNISGVHIIGQNRGRNFLFIPEPHFKIIRDRNRKVGGFAPVF